MRFSNYYCGLWSSVYTTHTYSHMQTHAKCTLTYHDIACHLLMYDGLQRTRAHAHTRTRARVLSRSLSLFPSLLLCLFLSLSLSISLSRYLALSLSLSPFLFPSLSPSLSPSFPLSLPLSLFVARAHAQPRSLSLLSLRMSLCCIVMLHCVRAGVPCLPWCMAEYCIVCVFVMCVWLTK